MIRVSSGLPSQKPGYLLYARSSRETATVTERSCVLRGCVTIISRMKMPARTGETVGLNAPDFALVDVYHALYLALRS
jgi:hypothetical protein